MMIKRNLLVKKVQAEKYLYKMKNNPRFLNKKAISTIIASVLMIALVLVLGGVVWSVVNNLVSEQLESAGSCYEVFDKVSLNSRYTCWNNSGNEVRFSINVKDIELQELVIAISGEGNTKSYTLGRDSHQGNVDTWPTASGAPRIPGNNSGRSYVVTGDFTSKPDSIQIFPVIGNNQCDAADTLNNIDSCFILA